MTKIIKFKLAFVVLTIICGLFASILFNDKYFLEYISNKTGVIFLPSLVEIASILVFIFSLLLFFPELYSAVEETTQTSSEEKTAKLTNESKKSLAEILESDGLDNKAKLEKIKTLSNDIERQISGVEAEFLEAGTWKEPLIDARNRLIDESRRLSERGTSNLTWGVMLSMFTIIAAIVIIVTTGRVSPPEKIIPLIALYGPRFTLVIVAQIVAGFFLGMYVRNEKDISRNKNEITNLNLRMAAGMLAESKIDVTKVVSQLAIEERNFVISKKEKSSLIAGSEQVNELMKTIQNLAKK